MSKPGVGNNGMPTDVNEYFAMLTKLRAREEKENPDIKDEPMVDPIICRGVADVIEAQEDEHQL